MKIVEEELIRTRVTNYQKMASEVHSSPLISSEGDWR